MNRVRNTLLNQLKRLPNIDLGNPPINRARRQETTLQVSKQKRVRLRSHAQETIVSGRQCMSIVAVSHRQDRYGDGIALDHHPAIVVGAGRHMDLEGGAAALVQLDAVVFLRIVPEQTVVAARANEETVRVRVRTCRSKMRGEGKWETGNEHIATVMVRGQLLRRDHVPLAASRVVIEHQDKLVEQALRSTSGLDGPVQLHGVPGALVPLRGDTLDRGLFAGLGH